MRHHKFILIGFIFLLNYTSKAQNNTKVSANFYPNKNRVEITQNIALINNSDKVLDSVFLVDWNNSYSSKNSELAKRFAD